MALALRYRSTPVAPLLPLQGLTIRRETDANVIAMIQGRPIDDMARRFADGHRVYVAEMNGVPAAWGWVGTRTATIGELNVSFDIANDERYLWNFVTRPEFRGLGIYPRLIEAIVCADAEADRFWIAYAPENRASGNGIHKAGFEIVAELSFDSTGLAALTDRVPGGALLAAKFLGVRASDGDLAQCWRCVRAGRLEKMSCDGDSCECDYQVPQSGCAA
jgi:hypothetical protein